MLTGVLGTTGDLINTKLAGSRTENGSIAMGRENYLWSMVWDDSLLRDEQFKLFSKRVEKFGYKDVKKGSGTTR